MTASPPFTAEHALLRRITLVMGNRNQLQWDLPALDSFELNRAVYRVPRNEFLETRDELIEARRDRIEPIVQRLVVQQLPRGAFAAIQPRRQLVELAVTVAAAQFSNCVNAALKVDLQHP